MTNADKITYGHTKIIKEKYITMQEPTITFIECLRLESLYKKWCESYDKLMDNSIPHFIEWADKFGLINTNRVKELGWYDKC